MRPRTWACVRRFDGTKAWVAGRAHNAITSQLNPVDLTRRSPSYEMRLSKYAKRGVWARHRSGLQPPSRNLAPPALAFRAAWRRCGAGFEVAVPNLDRPRVDPMIFERAWTNVQGLAKLILLEKLNTPEARFEVRAARWVAAARVVGVPRGLLAPCFAAISHPSPTHPPTVHLNARVVATCQRPPLMLLLFSLLCVVRSTRSGTARNKCGAGQTRPSATSATGG